MLKVATLTQTYCQPGEVFVHRMTQNPHVECVVLCNTRDNETLYPHGRVHVRHMAQGTRKLLQPLSWKLAHYSAKPFARWELRRFLKQERPDVFHVHFGYVARVFLEELRAARVPWVVTFHGSDINGAIYNEAKAADLLPIFKEATRCHFVSEALRSVGASLGCPAEKSRVIYLGAPIPHERTRISVLTDVVRFTCVARLVPVKGHETLIQAFRQVVNRIAGARLQLLGGGPLEGKLRALVAELELEANVLFEGQVSNEHVLGQLHAATDVVVLASHRDSQGREEGLPIALTEAAALGLPCVATRLGGIPELIEHNSTGLLVPGADVAALADAMTQMALSPEMRRSFGEAARRKAESQFDLNKQLRKIADLYEEVAASPHTGNGRVRLAHPPSERTTISTKNVEAFAAHESSGTAY